MSTAQKATFEELNQRYLVTAITRVRNSLEYHLNQERDDSTADGTELTNLRADMEFTPPLETVCAAFSLSPFERDILLLCAGVELDSSLLNILHETGNALPTFSLALSALPGAHWSALSPETALRYWRLIELKDADNLTNSPIKIDECILHYLTGLRYFDVRTSGYIKPVPAPGTLVPSHQEITRQVAAVCRSKINDERPPLIQLCGKDAASLWDVAAAASANLGFNLNVIHAQVIPSEPGELEGLARLWNRQAVLTRGALLLDCSDIDAANQALENTIKRFVDEVHSVLIQTGQERTSVPERGSVSFDVNLPTAGEQIHCWRQLLAGDTSVEIEPLVSQFNLNTATISSIFEEAAKLNGSNVKEDFGTVLWETCRVQSRRKLDEMAERIGPHATWDDLVLPEAPLQTLKEIAAQVRQRLKVYETWGFASRISRGLGVTALFSGASGTGKTMAAEVLANELHLDLYRIDLSQVVSKYIGETEKNLKRVFQAAEDGGALLLFDEADALFGKRSEVKDSHDRYANIEISYLLQRMENYHGLAVLTTNMKEVIDTAFLRRLRFIVHFPFPSTEQRKEIWRRIFPAATPVENLDMDKLARLNLSGGNIRNIALYSAFLAAEADEPVRMKHLLRAARVEYAKLEISMTDSEIKGWV